MITLRKYVPSPNHDEVEDWFSGLTDAEQADVDRKLEFLEASREHWRNRKRYKRITEGVGKGLGEIKLKYRSSNIRLIGFMGPYRDDYTIVKLEHKKKGRLSNDVWKTAQERKKRVLKDRNLSHAWNR